MPYSLRKAPGRPLYWVVGEDGKHFSKDPMPKADAKAQLRALYAKTKDEMRGKGLWDTITQALYDGYNEVADSDSWFWSNVDDVGDLDSNFWVTPHFPKDVQAFYDKHKDVEIVSITLRRAPVQKALELALQAFSLGKWEEAKEKMGYDVMFHTAIILNQRTGKPFIVEKLARPNIGPVDDAPYAEFYTVDTDTGPSERFTLGVFIERTQKRMGDAFWKYDPFTTNCQNFVDNCMMANQMSTEYDAQARAFVLQDAKSLVADLPRFMPKFARTITSLGGLTGGALDGQGDDSRLEGMGMEGIDVEALYAALDGLVGGAFAPKFLYETAENRDEKGARPRELVRTLKDVELGLRAIAHREDAAGRPLSAFGARVMADDAFEHATGKPVDWEHDNYAKKTFIRAFRDSRPDQIAELGRVNSVMAQYEVPRDRAYRIAFEGEAPPRRAEAPKPVARVKSPAELRAEMEAETRRMEEEARRREEEARRREEEEARRQQEAERERERAREEEARRLEEEAEREAERLRREAEEARREAEEAEKRRAEAQAQAQERAERLKEEQERADQARAVEQARAKAARLALEAMEETDEDLIAIKEEEAIRAVLEKAEAAQSSVRGLALAASFRMRGIKRDRELAERRLEDPSTEVLANFDVEGPLEKPYGDGKKASLWRVILNLKDLKTLIRKLEQLNKAWNSLSEQGKEDARKNPNSDAMAISLGVRHPTARGDTVPMRLLPEYYEGNLKTAQRAVERLEAEYDTVRAEARALLARLPAREAEVARLEAEGLEKLKLVEEAEKEAKELEKKFAARQKERETLRKQASKAGPVKKKKGKGKPLLGDGGQHKPFKYSRPNLSAAEKARERAAHYRRVKAEKEGAYEPPRVPAGIHATKGVAHFDETGKELSYYDKEKTSKGKPKKVVLTPAQKETEEARGLKPVKEKVPKKGSVRKPYVGSKMKEQLFMASPYSDHLSKEFKSLLRRASKLYKAGGRSWESVMKEVLGQ